MRVLRFILLVLLFASTAAAAEGIALSSAIDTAMRCIRAAMTNSLLPVGVMTEQIANVALARCSDEIESAATAVASRTDKRGGIEIARARLRMQLYDYALEVAAGSYASHAVATDVSAETPAQPRINW